MCSKKSVFSHVRWDNNNLPDTFIVVCAVVTCFGEKTGDRGTPFASAPVRAGVAVPVLGASEES